MNIFEMKQNREAAIARAESAVQTAETAGRAMSASETENFNSAIAEANALTPQIASREALSTIRAAFPAGRAITETGNRNATATRATDYLGDFTAWAQSRGRVVGEHLATGADGEGGFRLPNRSAALYEGAPTGGSNAAGGFAVPSQVDGQFVPLAPPEMGVYALVNVVPTTMDTRYVRKDIFGTATAKAESGATTSSFGGNDAAIGQFTLTANMLGHSGDISWELLQDVPQFLSFIADDQLLSMAVLREQWIVNGTGTGMAQGLLGNVGAGVTAATADSNGNLLSIASTETVLGILNAAYHPNASYLMNRSTSILLRAAQRQANLFDPIFTRVGKQEFLHGYPVAYSSAMPLAAAGSTPVLFGDFKAGYIYGERGGSGVNVKLLDQPKALQGLVTVLSYQRADGRVRRSEAVQAITLHI